LGSERRLVVPESLRVTIPSRLKHVGNIELLNASVVSHGSPFAVVTYAVDGKVQDLGLRLDLDKQVFLDKVDNPRVDDVLRGRAADVGNAVARGLEQSRTPGSEATTQAASANLAAGASIPQVKVRETEKEVEVTAELPDMEETDVGVTVADRLLTISGEKITKERGEEEYTWRDRSWGRIKRVVPLPEGLNLGSARASFESGVLTVTIDRDAEAQAKAEQIPQQEG
jgi:HSP20 family molecular chaperone IbpA